MKVYMGKSRSEAFSDGVIAILLTLMAFDLKITLSPETTSSGADWRLLTMHILPKLLAYAMSYLVIAILWINHHALFDRMEKITRAIIWLNVLLLFVMSLIPMATNYLAGAPFERTAVQLYGLVLAMNAGVFAWLRHYASKRLQLLEFHPGLHLRNIMGTSLYLAAVALAWISVLPAYLIFIGIPLWYFVPPFHSSKQ